MNKNELLIVDGQTESGLYVAKKPLSVVKIGGTELPRASDVIAEEHHANLHDLVIVHGGGPQISARQQRAGLETKWAQDGTRVTDVKTRAIVVEVLDEVNAQLTESLDSRGVVVIGYNSKAGLIEAEPISSENLTAQEGSVRVDSERLFSDLYEDRTVPVVAPVATSKRHGFVNVNGDNATAVIARSIGARPIFITGAGGVRKEGQVLRTLDKGAHQSLRESGTINGGMDYKVEQAFNAGGGVIVDLRNLRKALSDENAGTRIRT